ncbi:hypothetical protein BC826DRAFT_967269 [Russula brevipes]|nr:hypothetical protein BC826DRAFT_967269 [Russula brevipes]
MRAYAKDTFDIRMVVVEKMRSRRGHHGYAPAGGYELRRKDWAEATQRFPAFSPEYWGALTIYIVRAPSLIAALSLYVSPKENIPLLFRSMVGLSKLLHSLLPRDCSLSSTADYRCIQSIYFPPHHQDPPDVIPKCKGFALVTLSESSATSHLLTRFPYHKHANNRRDPPADDDDDASPEELEARKAGFRTLSKERWEALQSEYVEYRDALLRHVAASSSASAPTPARVSAAPAPPVVIPPSPNPPTSAVASVGRAKYASMSQPPRAETPPSYYPPGCVIFVRHIPQDTNKTALRARFSAVFADDDPAALDYVDYTKGLDSCYLRLTTREHALLLLKRFEKEQGTGEAVALELLDGRREEMYWECVPDKVRALAVQRAQVHGAQQKNGGRVQAADEDASVGMGGRKRRRRHG